MNNPLAQGEDQRTVRRVVPAERIAAIHGPYEVQDGDTFSYEWHQGYETLIVKYDNGGAFEYRGVFHPGDGSCVGRGICKWCGRTLHD